VAPTSVALWGFGVWTSSISFAAFATSSTRPLTSESSHPVNLVNSPTAGRVQSSETLFRLPSDALGSVTSRGERLRGLPHGRYTVWRLRRDDGDDDIRTGSKGLLDPANNLSGWGPLIRHHGRFDVGGGSAGSARVKVARISRRRLANGAARVDDARPGPPSRPVVDELGRRRPPRRAHSVRESRVRRVELDR